MKGFKKVTALLLATTMVLGMTACGSETKPATEEPEATETEVSENADAEATTEDAKEVTLTVWSIATESDAFHPAYLKAIEEFEAAHPGVTIDLPFQFMQHLRLQCPF